MDRPPATTPIVCDLTTAPDTAAESVDALEDRFTRRGLRFSADPTP